VDASGDAPSHLHAGVDPNSNAQSIGDAGPGCGGAIYLRQPVRRVGVAPGCTAQVFGLSCGVLRFDKGNKFPIIGNKLY